MANSLDGYVNSHCTVYPTDATYLGQIMNLNIQRREQVYISGKSSKYHQDSRCSGMKNSIPMDKKEATELGLKPCDRCVRK